MEIFFKLLIFISLVLSLHCSSVDASKLSSNDYSSHMNGGCIVVEREALLKFKSGLEDPSGRLSSWVGNDCCVWNGVRCSVQTGHVIKLDLKNQQQPISNLSGKEAYEHSCLGGNLNPSLIDLKYLYYLDLSLNNFQGLPIPNFIGSLNQLIYLNLSRSSFSGLVPPHLGNLSNLRSLDLFALPYRNIDAYTITSDMNWIARLTRLEYLNLGYVNLKAASPTWLQVVNMLPSLTELHLPGCNLNHLTHSLSKVNFSSLSVLDLSENEFNSTMPQWLFNLSSLMHLNLENCEIQNLMPSGAGRSFCNLRGLYLRYNDISGDITDFLGSISECSNNSLEILSLGGNRISGQIPESIGKFKYLKHLDLRANSFSGSIPFSIGNLSFLETLDLSQNKMNGIITENIGQLWRLVTLDLSSNYWKGVVSEVHFSDLANLKSFLIQCQSLSIDLRHEWIPPFSLKSFGVYDCHCGSSFPSWLKTQKHISFLAMSTASISGKIPDWVWELSQQLGWLDLSNNQFDGEVPSSLQFKPHALVDLSSNLLEGSLPVWYGVESLYLNSNLFSGQIPPNFFHEIPFLLTMHISDNNLTGSIPSSISSLNRLWSLDLSKNHLSGTLNFPWEYLHPYAIDLSNNTISGEIPKSICSSSYLQVLALHGNNLSGKPFSSLRNCSRLISLDLGENRFFGRIPNWVGKKLSNLRVLGLRHNKFNGKIPGELCSLPGLHILDLAHNNFSGFIPSCIGNLRGLKSLRYYVPFNPHSYGDYYDKMELVSKGRELEYVHILRIVNTIDFSSNSFNGEIPQQVASLTYLGTLNLSLNQLTGKIPEKIADLQSLETLDLSLNHLSGSIPPSMSSMTFLCSLNFSYNNLSGPIPLSNQFNTFNDPSIYEGNSQLCGPPLPKNCYNSMNENPSFKQDQEEEDEDCWIDMQWFFIGIGPGFVVGFWVVCGSLILKKSWRNVYFWYMDIVKDKIYLFIAVNKARLMRKWISER